MDLKQINQASKHKAFKLIESRFGLKIDPAQLTREQAKKILESAEAIISQVKASPNAQLAHKDPKYLQVLMVKEAMSKYMQDFKPENSPGCKTSPKMKPVKAVLKEMSQGQNQKKLARILELVMEGKSVPAKYFDLFAPIVSHLVEMTEKRRFLSESEMEKSEVLLAAKDIVNSIQDMIEDMSRTLNEEIPALSDSIRDTMGANASQAYLQTVNTTLNSLLDNLKTARQSMDDAARSLAGEEVAQPTQEPVDASSPDTDSEQELPVDQDEFAGFDAATGGTQPTGREER